MGDLESRNLEGAWPGIETKRLGWGKREGTLCRKGQMEHVLAQTEWTWTPVVPQHGSAWLRDAPPSHWWVTCRMRHTHPWWSHLVTSSRWASACSPGSTRGWPPWPSSSSWSSHLSPTYWAYGIKDKTLICRTAFLLWWKAYWQQK